MIQYWEEGREGLHLGRQGQSWAVGNKDNTSAGWWVREVAQRKVEL